MIPERAANPSVHDMLEAAPMLHWRRCQDCEHIGLHVDDIHPWVKCAMCGSMDTRKMIEASKALRLQKCISFPEVQHFDVDGNEFPLA